MALLPLVEMGRVPPIVPGMTCFGQLIDFLTAMYIQTIAVVQLRSIVEEWL